MPQGTHHRQSIETKWVGGAGVSRTHASSFLLGPRPSAAVPALLRLVVSPTLSLARPGHPREAWVARPTIPVQSFPSSRLRPREPGGSGSADSTGRKAR